MTYFQNWFFSQVIGNLSRESVSFDRSDCIRLKFKKDTFGINLSIQFDIMTW